MKTTYSLLFLFIMIFVTSCTNQVPFNREGWNTINDIDYNHREPMIKDLQTNYLKSGMYYNDVLKLLGTNGVGRSDNDLTLKYDIFVDYGWDIDPVETKIFIVNFLADSTYVSSEITHWKK